MASTLDWQIIRIRGSISSAGFADGNRFVVGHWERSPIGPFGDVMWGTPDGQRVLLAGSQEIADFVTSIYNFDDIRVGNLQTESDGLETTVRWIGFGSSFVRRNGPRYSIFTPSFVY